MPLAPEYFTADMVRALPDDGQRYELVWGELLVNPSPASRHQRIVGRLFYLLTVYCDALGSLETMFSPADISWGTDTLVQPDVFVVPKTQARASDWAAKQTLALVAEVLSPSTARHDRFQKRRLYQAQGVGTLWLADPDRRTIEVWTPERAFPVIETERVSWQPAGAGAPLIIELTPLFADA